MKNFIVSTLLFCIVVFCNAQRNNFGTNQLGRPRDWPPRSTGPNYPRPPKGMVFNHRFRREASPQDTGSISLDAMKPLSGPNRQPSIDLNYNHHILQDQRGHVDAFGGGNYDGRRLTPHAGIKLERNYNNGFIGGYGQVQPGPRGGVDPSFGVRGGFRF